MRHRKNRHIIPFFGLISQRQNCAAVSLADVTSANVVGYSQIALRAGSKMSGASFNMVAKQNMDLTELVPSGYENNSAYISGKTAKGIQGDIVIVILGSNGIVEKDENGYDKTYAWYHSYATKTGWAAAGVWKQAQGSGYADMKPGDVKFPMGTGLWVQVPKNFNEGMLIEFPGVDDAPAAE